MIERDALAIYLNDHLAGATVGCELARRSRDANRGTELGGFLAELVDELDRDRSELREIMDCLGVTENRVKVLAGWTAEKAGRLKLNGRFVKRSPLSGLTELEGLYFGISGKLSLWRNLDGTVGERLPGFDLARLVGRAERQRDQVADRCLEVAAVALA